jgi:hypothetical protein
MLANAQTTVSCNNKRLAAFSFEIVKQTSLRNASSKLKQTTQRTKTTDFF